MTKAAPPVRLFIDAIEEGVARVLLDDEAFSLPVRILPHGVAEGDWIELSARVIPPPPEAAKDTDERRKRLVADDPGGPVKL